MKLPRLAPVLVAAIIFAGLFVSIAATGRWDELITQPIATTKAAFEADGQRHHPDHSDPSGAHANSDPAGVSAAGSALRELDDVDVAHTRRTPPYDRRDFGSSWLDVDRNGCDTRNDILARDLIDLVREPAGCVVLRGTLDDPYTGTRIPFTRGIDTSAAVQIDHIVPLSYAWTNGAWAWDDAERQRFANDPDNLLATDGPSNMSKSDSGPGEWMPENHQYRCAYSIRFVDVVSSYDLTVEADDVAELRRTLEGCS